MERLRGITSRSRMSPPAGTMPRDATRYLRVAFDSVEPCTAAPAATHSSGLMDEDGSLPVSARTLRLHGGHARGAAHQQHLSQLRRGDARIHERLLHRAGGCAPPSRASCSRTPSASAPRPGARGRRNPAPETAGSRACWPWPKGFALRLACGLAHALQGRRVVPHVHAACAFELLQQVVGHALVEVVAAQVVVGPPWPSTSMTPSPISMMDTSNVPPPKSYTITFCGVARCPTHRPARQPWAR